MADQYQWRRGTTNEHSTFAGAVSEVTVNSDKDNLVVHDGSTLGGFPVQSEIYTNVKDFGATGDGVTNDTTAIEAALAEGGTVWFPEGDYLVGPCKIGVSDTHLLANRDTRMVAVNDQQRVIFYVPTTILRVVIEGLTFVGKNTTEVATGSGASLGAISVNTNSAGTDWSNVAQDGFVSILRCTIKGSIAGTDGFNIGIANNKSDNLTVRDCHIENVIGNESGFGYGMTVSGEHITVEDNVWFQSTSLPTLVSGRHAVYINFISSHCRVSNNCVYNYYWAGISIKGALSAAAEHYNMHIVDNYLENCNRNNVSGGAALQVNSIEGSPPFARMVGVHVVGNTFNSNFGAQIRMESCDQGVMRGNVAFNLQAFGAPTFVQRPFEGVDCTETVIMGNIARDIPSEDLGGIFLQQFRDGVVSHNVLQAATSLAGGINLNATVTQSDGNIIGPNKFIGTITDRIDDDTSSTGNIKIFDHLQISLTGFAPGAIAAGGNASTTVTVTGAETFDAVLVTPQNQNLGSNFFTFQARVSAADTVQLTIRNIDTSSQTPAVNNYFIDVFKRQ